MTELLFKEEVYAIAGAAMAVYNELGSGFLEWVRSHQFAQISVDSRKKNA